MSFNRRAFLRRAGAAVLGLTLGRLLSGIAPPEPGLDEAPVVRMTRYYDNDSGKSVTRMDVMMAWSVVRPDYVCRVTG